MFMRGHKFISAFGTAKIEILSIDSLMDSISLGEINFTKRVLYHYIGNLTCTFAEDSFPGWVTGYQPGFKNSDNKINNPYKD
jgi:hypothetical protein